MDDVTIYHNPACGTSRNVLGLIRNAGIEPRVIEYLKTPPDRGTLTALIARMGVPVRDVVRAKEAIHGELGLDRPGVDDATLIEAMLAHPDHQMTVLCGHTHSSGEAQILPNLRVLTGGAVYGQPCVQQVFEIE